MLEKVTISYRGAGYELGGGRDYFAVWGAGAPRSRPLGRWPRTPEGWSAAWARFTGVEVPGTIEPAGARSFTAPGMGSVTAPGTRAGTIIAAALLAAGVALGIAGLFPAYLNGASIAAQPPVLVPHVIYLAVWAASAALIVLGGARLGIGALLAVAMSVVTFGFFFADAGTAIAGGAHVMGAGLALWLVAWLASAIGSALAFVLRPGGAPGRPRGEEVGPALMLLFGALGAAIAFAPSWDRYILRTAPGASQTVTAGNVFANAAPVIAGNVAVMIALVVVVAIAALWRPGRQGAVLLAGAVIPMAAQAVSALIQAGEATSPALFGISQAQASQAGLTIGTGLTAVYWIYCAFVLALAVSCVWMLVAPRPAAAGPSASGPARYAPPGGYTMPGGAAPGGHLVPGGAAAGYGTPSAAAQIPAATPGPAGNPVPGAAQAPAGSAGDRRRRP